MTAGKHCISTKCDFVRVSQNHSSNVAAYTALNVTFMWFRQTNASNHLTALLIHKRLHLPFTKDGFLQCFHLSLGPLG